MNTTLHSENMTDKKPLSETKIRWKDNVTDGRESVGGVHLEQRWALVNTVANILVP